MTDVETLSERVRTVERAVTEGDHTFPEVDDIAELTERVDDIEQRVEELDERTTELEAATQALRGYVGNVRSVNERVEQRADTALAATERLERRFDASETGTTVRAGSDDSEDTPVGAPIDRSGRAEGASDAAGQTADERERPADASAFEFGGTERPTDDADESDDSGVLERVRSLL